MQERKEELSREDYIDPQCPFCTDAYEKTPPVRSIPTGRILEKLDQLLGANDYAGAEQLLLYWLEEASLGRDLRGEFQLRNELMGLYRKLGRGEEAMQNADLALSLADRAGISGTVAHATALLNAATVRKAFGMAKEAIPLFRQAQELYERNLAPNDPRMAGLCNNMALALTDLGSFGEARQCYERAVRILRGGSGNEPEIAVTMLNLANLEEAERGLEDGAEAIESALSQARELLDMPGLARDGNYAFVCEKCAPTFGYYGYFAYAGELEERAKTIYDRNGTGS